MIRLPQRPSHHHEFPTRQAALPLLDVKWSGPPRLPCDRVVDLVTEAQADRARLQRAVIRRAARMVARPFLVVAASWRAWQVRRREREELAQLDERSLRDIGISRYDAIMAGRRPRRDD